MTTYLPLEEIAQKFPFLYAPPSEAAEKDAPQTPYVLLERSLRFVTLMALAHSAVRRNIGLELSHSLDEHLGNLSGQACARLQSLMLAHDTGSLVEVFGLPLRNPVQVRLFVETYRALLTRMEHLDNTSRTEEAIRVLAEEYSEFLVRRFHARIVSIREEKHGLSAYDVVARERMDIEELLPVSTGRGLHLVDDLAASFTPIEPLFCMHRTSLLLYEGHGPDGVCYTNGRGDRLVRLERDELIAWAELCVRLGAYRQALALFHDAGKNLFPNKERTRLYRYARIAASGMEHFSEQDYGKAIEEFERALALDDSHPPLYYATAHAHRRGGDSAQAIATLRRLLARYPDKVQAEELLGDLFAERDSAEAIRFYEKVLAASLYQPGVARKRDDLKERLANKPGLPASAKAPGRAPVAKPREEAPSAKPSGAPAPAEGPSADELLVDMLAEAEGGRYRPIVGREGERAQAVEILCCRAKSNVLLVGEPGVGKTALVEDLALRLSRGEAPRALQGKRLYAFNSAAAIAGAKYRGQFEERILQVIRKLSDQPSILFVDDIHTLSSMGASKGGSLDLASLIKPSLLRGEFQAVAAAPYEDYRSRLEKDTTLARCFQVVRLDEPGREETLAILSFHKEPLENHHRVRLSEELFAETFKTIALCLKERAFPDKALDVFDRASVKAALRANGTAQRQPAVTPEDVHAAISDLSGVPFAKVASMRESRYRELETLLEERIIGQESAIRTVARALKTAKLNFSLKPQRPEGIFLFVGPTGVGKTELARAMAEVLYGETDRMIRIDMSEYMERISSSRLIGTAPGYVGYNDPNQLTDMVRRNPYSLILLDEIEKADAQVMNLFLQVFDAGRLTDGKGRIVHFNHTTIVMTGNIGTELYSEMRIGYDEVSGRGGHVSRSALTKRIKRSFAPEFLNRLDEIVQFDPLAPESIKRIAELKLRSVRERMAEEGKTLHLAPAVYERLVAEGYSPEFGARHLERVIRRLVLDPLADASLSTEWDEHRHIQVDEHEGRTVIGYSEEPCSDEVLAEGREAVESTTSKEVPKD